MTEIKVTVDIVVFSMKAERLNVLLIKRKYQPFRGKWALPGGFILPHEDILEAANRELKEETGVFASYLEQLYTFGKPKRDPRGQVVTVSYFALLNHVPELSPSTDAADSAWFPVYAHPELAFDHKEILTYAVERLRNKFEYTTASFTLLPEKFTLTELQRVYEEVLNKQLDKRNFRKKIISHDILIPTGELKKMGSARPAELFHFSSVKFESLRSRGVFFPF